MKVAIIGSRSLKDIDISKYLPSDITLVISGGANGIDTLAEKFADKQRISKLIILPDYKRYGKTAPLVRNRYIVDHADIVFAFWDGISRGTKFTIDYAKSINKNTIVFNLHDNSRQLI